MLTSLGLNSQSSVSVPVSAFQVFRLKACAVTSGHPVLEVNSQVINITKVMTHSVELFISSTQCVCYSQLIDEEVRLIQGCSIAYRT